MAIRWSTPGFNIGYGVSGENVTNDTLIKIVDMRQLTQEIPKLAVGLGEGESFVALILTIRWRFTLRVISANDADISVYDAILGKRKLGTYNIESYQYTSYSGFWSNDLYVSPRFTFRTRYVDYELPEIDPPCSEPQLDLPELFFEGGTFFPWTGYYSVYQNYYDEIGERLLLSVAPGVTSYRLGVTYDWDWEGFTAERIENEGGAPNIYIL